MVGRATYHRHKDVVFELLVMGDLKVCERVRTFTSRTKQPVLATHLFGNAQNWLLTTAFFLSWNVGFVDSFGRAEQQNDSS